MQNEKESKVLTRAVNNMAAGVYVHCTKLTVQLKHVTF